MSEAKVPNLGLIILMFFKREILTVTFRDPCISKVVLIGTEFKCSSKGKQAGKKKKKTKTIIWHTECGEKGLTYGRQMRREGSTKQTSLTCL